MSDSNPYEMNEAQHAEASRTPAAPPHPAAAGGNATSSAPQPAEGSPRSYRWLIIGLVIFAMFAAVLTWINRPGPDNMGWHELAHAKVVAAKSHKLILLDFTAEWCGPCQEMKRTTFTNPDVAKLIDQRFIPVKMDLTERNASTAKLAHQWTIYGIPTLVVLDADGKELTRTVGFQSPSQLLSWVQPYVSQPIAESAPTATTPSTTTQYQ